MFKVKCTTVSSILYSLISLRLWGTTLLQFTEIPGVTVIWDLALSNCVRVCQLLHYRRWQYSFKTYVIEAQKPKYFLFCYVNSFLIFWIYSWVKLWTFFNTLFFLFSLLVSFPVLYVKSLGKLQGSVCPL